MPKIKRNAFVYLESSSGTKNFAQCGTCALKSGDNCLILGHQVPNEASCALYVPGAGKGPIHQGLGRRYLSNEEAGYVEGAVRCENCASYDKKHYICKMFTRLNINLTAVFDLDESVSPQGCCNGWTKK